MLSDTVFELWILGWGTRLKKKEQEPRPISEWREWSYIEPEKPIQKVGFTWQHNVLQTSRRHSAEARECYAGFCHISNRWSQLSSSADCLMKNNNRIAARLCLKRLNQPQRSLAFFEAAEKSPVPHLDWEQSISAGIREAEAALSQNAAVAGAGH